MNGKSERSMRCEVYFTNSDTELANLNLKPCRNIVLCEAVKVDCSFAVKTLEGQLVGQPGDYLMKGPRGEFYVQRSDVFEENYEFVEGAGVKKVHGPTKRRGKVQPKQTLKAAS